MTYERSIEEFLKNAWDLRREAKYDLANYALEKAQEHCKEDDYISRGRIFHIYAQFESDHDNPSRALKLLQRSLSFYKKTGSSIKIAHSTRHIADLERRIGDVEDSESNYRTSIDIYKSNKSTSKVDLANAIRGYALVLEKRGKIQEAIEAWKEARELYRACKLEEGVDEANLKLDSLIYGREL